MIKWEYNQRLIITKSGLNSVSPVPPESSGVVVYLLQLFLDHPLLLSDVAELGGVLLGEDSAGLLGCSLFGRQSFLGLAVSGDLVLQEALLHLQELLRLPQPLLVLTALRLVCRRHDSFDFIRFCIRLYFTVPPQNKTQCDVTNIIVTSHVSLHGPDK